MDAGEAPSFPLGFLLRLQGPVFTQNCPNLLCRERKEGCLLRSGLGVLASRRYVGVKEGDTHTHTHVKHTDFGMALLAPWS